MSRQAGVIGTIQARRHLSKAEIAHLLRSGRWSGPHRCVLVAHNGPLAEEQRLWVAALAAGSGRPALLGGRTALAVLGLKGFPCDRTHVLLPAWRHPTRPPSGVVVHRTSSVPDDDLALSGHPSTSAARSVVDAASWARSDDEARTVVAMAFQQNLTTLDAMTAVLDRMPRAKRRHLVRVTAADADGGAHSLGELYAVRLVRQAGLPDPTSQTVRVDAAGRRRYLDLYWEKYDLHVEIDGAHHADIRQAWADMERENALWPDGRQVVRIPAFVVREQPAAFVRKVRRALLASGWVATRRS